MTNLVYSCHVKFNHVLVLRRKLMLWRRSLYDATECYITEKIPTKSNLREYFIYRVKKTSLKYIPPNGIKSDTETENSQVYLYILTA